MKKIPYNMNIKETYLEYKTSENGLSNLEASKRNQMYGKNILPESKKKTIIGVFISQFNEPITYILIVAALLSVLIKEYTDAFLIFFVILCDAILGTIQEWRASKNAELLKNMLDVEATVLRDGLEVKINAKDLTVGDVVLLSSGDKVSADLRIVSAYNLKADESSLTGESIAQLKDNKTIKGNVSLADRKNMLFAGTTITSGRGMAIVSSIGSDTEFGSIATKVIEEKETASPLTIRMEKFSKQIGFVFSVLAFVLTLVLYLKGGFSLQEIFLQVVALSVSAIPEGLSVSMTLALSIASSRMAKKGVLVKKLNSVESLGSCTVIASDKTGTLTVNEQTAKIIVLPNGSKASISGSGYDPIGYIKYDKSSDSSYFKEMVKMGAINNEAHLDNVEGKWIGTGDSVDIAFLTLAAKFDVDYYNERNKLVGSIPYESEERYSAAFYKDGKTYSTIKGSCEKVLTFCDTMFVNGRRVKIDKKKLNLICEDLSKEGYRVIALASGVNSSFTEKNEYDSKDVGTLTFMGFVGFIDPIREETVDALKKAKKAGIKTIMITGDHPLTATKIAYDLNLISDDDEVATGEEVDAFFKEGPYVFDTFVKSKTVFSRVSPVDKYHIVESLKRQGEFVAVTGDGVNDALAMKAANIGIAIGSGTEVAKETGSMIITDDDFGSIVKGIEEGRIAYNNVRKVIYMLLSCGIAEVLFFVLAIVFGYDIPLLAVQLLWLNLVTDGIQDCALAFEKGHGDEMDVKPRNPKEGVFDPLMIKELLLSGLYMGLLVFGVWVVLLDVANISVDIARSYVLLLMVFLQNIHVFNCRSETKSVFKLKLKDNILLVISIPLVILMQLIVSETEFLASFIKVQSLAFKDVLIMFVLALPILLLMEAFKKYENSKRGNKS